MQLGSRISFGMHGYDGHAALSVIARRTFTIGVPGFFGSSTSEIATELRRIEPRAIAV
jgi:hypothetical protein